MSGFAPMRRSGIGYPVILLISNISSALRTRSPLMTLLAQRTLGLPVDPFMRQFGRGGAGAGYESKLSVIEHLRASYFEDNTKRPQTIFENINAVPLDYLNSKLLAKQGSLACSNSG
jgi:hypothetical protein